MPKKTTPQRPAKTKTEAKSPSNNRKITEEKKKTGLIYKIFREWKLILASFIVGAFLMVIIFVAIDSYRLYGDVLAQKEKRASVLQDIERWESVVSEYPDYRDGYYSLSLLYYQIKNKEKALFYVDRALEIDPNFTTGRNFREEIVD